MIDLENRLPSPGKEGRIKLTYEDGHVEYAKLEMADDPAADGTPWNRQTGRLLQADIREYPVADGVSVVAGDVVDVIDGKLNTSYAPIKTETFDPPDTTQNVAYLDGGGTYAVSHLTDRLLAELWQSNTNKHLLYGRLLSYDGKESVEVASGSSNPTAFSQPSTSGDMYGQTLLLRKLRDNVVIGCFPRYINSSKSNLGVFALNSDSFKNSSYVLKMESVLSTGYTNSVYYDICVLPENRFLVIALDNANESNSCIALFSVADDLTISLISRVSINPLRKTNIRMRVVGNYGDIYKVVAVIPYNKVVYASCITISGDEVTTSAFTIVKTFTDDNYLLTDCVPISSGVSVILNNNNGTYLLPVLLSETDSLSAGDKVTILSTRESSAAIFDGAGRSIVQYQSGLAMILDTSGASASVVSSFDIGVGGLYPDSIVPGVSGHYLAFSAVYNTSISKYTRKYNTLRAIGDVIGGNLKNTSSQAIAMYSGSAGDTIPALFNGTTPLTGIQVGTKIASAGVQGYSPQSNWLSAFPAWATDMLENLFSGLSPDVSRFPLVQYGTRNGQYSNTNSHEYKITFEFDPKIVAIYDMTSGADTIIQASGATNGIRFESSSSTVKSTGVATLSGNTITLWGTKDTILDISGHKYGYIALG